MYDVTMPKLSDSMEIGKIIKWRVKEGDAIHEGDVIAEIESDKAAMELESFHDGVVAKLLKPEGSEVAVGEAIARVGPKVDAATVKEAKPAATIADSKTAPALPPPKGRAPRPPAADKRTGGRATAESAAVGGAGYQPATRTGLSAPQGERKPAISPYARKLAEDKGRDYTMLAGTGPGGRIVAADVESAATGRPSPAAAAELAAQHEIKPSADEELPPIEVGPDEAEIEEASFRRKTLARRVTASKHVIPHFYLTRGVDVTALMARKEELKERYGATVTHAVMLACLKTLAQHPEAHRSYDRGRIIKWKRVNLGIAVDTDEGLTVAVLRDCAALSLKEIVERTNALVERARAGKLSAEERQHPTFTITNLGMFDVEHFQPIINPPSAITLGVASALPAALVRGDALFIGREMKLTLSCDHRIIDGVTAARFMKDLKALLEKPEGLVG